MPVSRTWLIAATTALCATLLPAGPGVLAQQPAAALVIEGGTLIDGNGGAPIADSMVVVQGTRIVSVGRRGQSPRPANARVIDATGKFVLPGLWDSQTSYSWFFGEAMLNYGITSTIDVGTNAETAVPHRDAVLNGKVAGPRAFTGISRVMAGGNGITGLETPFATVTVPRSAQDTRDIVNRFIAAGADYLIFSDGSLPLDYYRAAAEEAHKAGKAIFMRAYGPNLFPKDAAELGAAQLPHSAGVGVAVARNPQAYRDGRDDRTELDRYADMDDEKARELIRILVDRKVALVPTFMINFPGYPRDWDRFAAEARQFFTDPSLLAYYPRGSMLAALRSYEDIDEGAVRERRLRGFENAKRFHKMFADAGGRVIVSGNSNDRWVPGLDLLQEMDVMAEAGLTPMQIIQGSTKWAAELIHKQDTLGTVEAGKTADLVIVGADPLQDIRNLRKVDTVIFDGKVVARGYRRSYNSPFYPPGSATFSAVEGLPWVVTLKKMNRVPRDPGTSPQPAIEAIAPVTVTQGTAPAAIAVRGFNFVQGSAAHFRGRAVPTTFVSPTELRVTLDAASLGAAGRFDLTIVNPAPIDAVFTMGMWGNGTSNVAHVIVNYRY